MRTRFDSTFSRPEKDSFLVMNVINMCSPAEDPVYQYMAKKRSEGKKYQVYMMASANKFLRRYYASVNAYLGTLGSN